MDGIETKPNPKCTGYATADVAELRRRKHPDNEPDGRNDEADQKQ